MASNLLAQTTPPTLDDILSRHGLEKKHLERKIPAEMRLELLPLLDDWKMTGYYLGFEQQNLDDIEIDNPSEERRRVALLIKWEQRHGEEATYLKLAEAFHHRQKIAAVERLCKRLKEMDGGSSATCRPGDGDQNSEDEPGSSDNGSSTAVSEQPRASLSHQENEMTVPEDPGDEDDDEEIGMFRAHKTLLENSIDDLANMNPEKVSTQLKRRGLLDEHDCQLIDREVTKRAKNIKIIEVLQGRGPTAFDTFFKILSSTNEAIADNFLPVKYRILWFTSSPRYAATVTYALEKYFDRDAVFKSERQKQRGSYMLQKGRIFKRRLSSDILKDDEGSEPAKLAQDVELCLAFPISERGDTPRKALMDVFQELGSEMTVAVLSGVCVGVRGDGGARGEELRVKGGEVVLAMEAVSLDGHKRELPLSSALMEAKTHLSQLPEENKEWFGEAKEKLKGLEQASGIPIGEHPRLVPHFDTIRQDIQAPPTGQPHRLPRALASDSDTIPFYNLCAQHLSVERPWFSCKGAIGHDMLNNADPAAAQEAGSVCALMSTFFALEACKTIVDKLRLSSQTFNSRSK